MICLNIKACLTVHGTFHDPILPAGLATIDHFKLRNQSIPYTNAFRLLLLSIKLA